MNRVQVRHHFGVRCGGLAADRLHELLDLSE